MNRRAALKNLMLASAGTMVWAGCTESYVDVRTLYKDGALTLDPAHKAYLDKASNAILPLKELAAGMEAPSTFIMNQVNHSRSPIEVLNFANGFESFKALMSAAQISMRKSPRQVPLAIIKELVASNPPAAELMRFIGDVRWLSIWNLKSSEHYMTNFQEYAMIPPKYNGNAPV